MTGKTNWKLISKECGQNAHHLAQNGLTATLARDLLMGITRPFFIRFWHYFLEIACFSRRIDWWQNQSFIYFVLDFDFWRHFSSEATLRTWTQNHPQKVGTCPDLPLQLLSQNWGFKMIGLNHRRRRRRRRVYFLPKMTKLFNLLRQLLASR